jgi:hypothetical protein
MRALRKEGLLLMSDPSLPSITNLVAGERVKGSWWNHKRGFEIWRVLKSMSTVPGSLETRLVSGKVTFVHRKLWDYVLTICTSMEDWQTRSLSNEARSLMRKVGQRGQVRTDRVGGASLSGRSVSDAARELEKKLLIYSQEIHTEKGKHAKVLSSWSRWQEKMKFTPKPMTVESARVHLEQIVARLNGRYRGSGRLPWQ